MAAFSLFKSGSFIDGDWECWRFIELVSANVGDPSTDPRQAQDLAKWGKVRILYFSELDDCETAACAVQSSLCCDYGCGGKWCTFDTSWIMDLLRVCAPTARTSHPGATKTHSFILPQEAS